MKKMNSLKGAFQKMNTDSVTVLQGTVISIDPTEIQMQGDKKHIISEEILCIPKHIGKLEKGDVAYLLSHNKGKQYFVLGRD